MPGSLPTSVPRRPYNPITSTPNPFSPTTTVLPSSSRFPERHPYTEEDKGFFDPADELGSLESLEETSGDRYNVSVPIDLDHNLHHGAELDGFGVRANDTDGAHAVGEEQGEETGDKLWKILGEFFLGTRTGQILLSLTGTVAGIYSFRVVLKFVLQHFTLPPSLASGMRMFLKYLPPSCADLWTFLTSAFERMESQVKILPSHVFLPFYN